MKATKKEIAMIEETRDELLDIVNTTLDVLLLKLNGEISTTMPEEYSFPLIASTSLFVGKKPVAVVFGEERVTVKTWREVYAAIVRKCNNEPKCHEKLLYLRDKVAGRDRILLSRKPDGMRRSLKIDEDMYAETHYGTGTLLYILRDRILAHTGFDYSKIHITVKF